MSNRLFNSEALPGRVPGPEGGRSRKSAPRPCSGVVYMRSLWGMVRVDRPKKVRLVNGGLDRSPGRGVAGWQVLLCGWGGAALAGEVCCHWSRGSERLLPLGTSIRREEGRPIMAPGPALHTVHEFSRPEYWSG